MNASEFKVAESLAATGNRPGLTAREKHLVGWAVSLARGCRFCTGRRMEDALKAGIPYDTLRATIDLTATVNAGIVLRTAIQGATIHDIDQACEGQECSVGTKESAET